VSQRDRFFRLTPDWVLAAVERGGFRPTGHCLPLVCLENRVYDVRLEDGSHVVAKFYRPGRWGRDQILEEHRFLQDLRAAEIPVCAPLSFRDGSTLHEVEGIHYGLWPRTGGRSPDELRDEDLPLLGRLLARIHGVGTARRAPPRPAIDAHTLAEEPLALLESGGFLPPGCRRRYRAAVESLVALYAEASRGVPLHRIHGDCHRGNLLHGREGWFFLDFDDFAEGPAAQDVWMLIPGRDADSARQRALFLAAYREFRPFEERWLGLVEPLRGLRFVRYAAWIARRWNDPAFPSAFPHFGTDEYWEKETRDLEDHVAGLARAALPVEERARALAAEGPELTNKDFFWDL
jgi:Ser/Thr protein kinase RdoA (MazF antagonist)